MMERLNEKLSNRKEQLSEREEKLFDTSIFLFKLLLAGAFFQLILLTEPDTYGLQSFLASVTQEVLQFTGLSLERQGALLIGPASSYLVTQDCLGWKSMSAFTGLVFASSSSPGKIVRTAALGVSALFLVNIFRIVTTVYLSYMNIISFEIIHSFLWQWGLTAVVLVMWFGWMKRNEGR